MWIIIVVLAVAFVAGLVANHWVRPFATSEVQGVKLELLVSPLLTLSVLLLAFLLVQVFASYKTVRDASSEEAGKVLAEFDIAGYLPAEYAAPLQSSVICYSRAVAEIEWGLLDERAAVDPAVSLWGNKIDDPMARLASERSEQPYGTLLSVDRERAEARRKRITEARPSVPVELNLLLLGISALGVFSLAAFHVALRVSAGAGRGAPGPRHGTGRDAADVARDRRQVRRGGGGGTHRPAGCGRHDDRQVRGDAPRRRTPLRRRRPSGLIPLAGRAPGHSG